MTRRAAGWATAGVALLVAALLIGTQMLASAGTPAHRSKTPVPAASSQTPDGDDADGDADDDCADDSCGNAHSQAVHAWVKCKADKGKDACPKPAPPGQGLGHSKHSDAAHGPATADGPGHGLGRAHAPGQLKKKKAKPANDDQDDPDDDQDETTP